MLSPYEAIVTAVGESVGFDNIAGVATAVTTGGPGAVDKEFPVFYEDKKKMESEKESK